MFSTYCQLGFEHILDPQGYDHILFVMALCAVYSLKEWKKVLILVTAFTIGHSLTLALSAFKVISVDAGLIETLIPVTIILTGLSNIFVKRDRSGKNMIQYGLALFFGFIHGMGFSNFFKALMGGSDDIIVQLFSFNVGVELGQIIVVTLTMIASYLFINLFKLDRKYWNYFISGLAILAALQLLFF